MRAVTVLCLVGLALAVLGTAAPAGEPPVPIEGKLLVTGWYGTWQSPTSSAYFMEGWSDNIILAPPWFSEGDLSPLEDQVSYVVGTGIWPEHLADIWKADIDGLNAVNLSAGAGMGGINCQVSWSPDGSMIAFQHCDPEEGLLPCDAGFYVWVMNADGGDPHQVTPGRGSSPVWSPNGYRILCYAEGWGYATIDIDGTDIESVPNVGGGPDWSPDGSKIACSWWEWDVVDGEPGVWRQLGLTNADGSDPQVLVEQFISDADVAEHIANQPSFPLPDPTDDIQHWNGPVWPEWSPLGDRIAFIAAMPFDPAGPYHKLQDEVWVYDIATDDLTKITDDVWHDNWLSWNGYNTFPEDPEVTVDNITVIFSEVTGGGGLTTILRDDDPPELPGGYAFCGEYYDISTTATVEGPVTICMTYEDEDVPGGNEEALALLHYNETTEEWEDITISKDPVNNILCGQVDQLSIFGLAAIESPVFGGFRPPINSDHSSIFKGGRTIPVKFTLFDPLGQPITYAVAHLTTQWAPEGTEGSVVEYEEAASADAGNTFRYNGQAGQYIYNLSTKGMELGPRWLKVTLEGWPEFEASVLIALR